MKQIFAKIIATGSYLPKKIVTNKDLEKIVNTDDAWITERTGIKQRHIAASGEDTSDLAIKAATDALATLDGLDTQDDLDAPNTPNTLNRHGASNHNCQIDLVILATTTADNIFPSTASMVASKIGLHTTPAFDIQAVCAGFIYALATADAYIKSGLYKNILVIGAEKLSKIVNWQDRNTCILFGDGAGAIILQATEQYEEKDCIPKSKAMPKRKAIASGILSTDIASDGLYRNILKVANEGEDSGFITMEGREVFKHAVNKMSESSLRSLKKSGIKCEDVDFVIPHQANLRIMKATIKKLGISEEKLISTVAEHANTSAASIPIALDYAIKSGRIKQGNIISTQAIGGGLAWGSAVIKY